MDIRAAAAYERHESFRSTVPHGNRPVGSFGTWYRNNNDRAVVNFDRTHAVWQHDIAGDFGRVAHNIPEGFDEGIRVGHPLNRKDGRPPLLCLFTNAKDDFAAFGIRERRIGLPDVLGESGEGLFKL